MRKKLIDAIVTKFKESDPLLQTNYLTEALKRIPGDANLIAYALSLGIDTDILFSKGA